MKKLAMIILSILMLMSVSVTALAAEVMDSGDYGQTPVTLTVAPARFSVSVPTALPLAVDEDENISTASNVKIINNGHGSVKITNMTVTPDAEWTIVGYNDTDMTAQKVGAKNIALCINGDYTESDGSITFTAGNFPALSGASDCSGDELAIAYDALLPAQATALSAVSVATVVFTIGWNS